MKYFQIGVISSLATLFWAAANASEVAALPEAVWDKLPRWRGFNLLEKFSLGRKNRPFLEEDFLLISELGFNFVRLPMDYRFWIKDGNWETFDENVLQDIDQAVAWGEKYGIHVCINFHRAPGYCINERKQPNTLWKDPEAQRVCALHWRTFAARYKGIPNRRLSFNLFNEPSHVDADTYLRVAGMMVEAIRAEDPGRLIISDSFFGDNEELGKGLRKLKVAFSPHQYYPATVTHYKASWINGSDMWPPPSWPEPRSSGILYSPTKEGVPHDPLIVRGRIPAKSRIRLRVEVVSASATLVIYADSAEVWRKDFLCGPGEGEWQEAVFKAQWGLYQNIYNMDYSIEIPAEANELKLINSSGDWIRLGELGITPPGSDQPEDTVRFRGHWGARPADLRYEPGNQNATFTCDDMLDAEALYKEKIGPWKHIGDSGVGVHIGEFGVFNKTPHAVALRWMEDTLRLLKENDMGWALWNFRGGFGVLDSGRKDVDYVDCKGHKLDKAMLELLQRY